MSHPFEMWSDRVAAADSDPARRALLAELAVWRAQHLTDVSASRRATYTLARLHQLMEDRTAAVREAHSLMSLCRTPPEATGDEVDAARAFLQSLGERTPNFPTPSPAGRSRGRRERPERGQRGREPRARIEESLEGARQFAATGDWSKARRALQGRKGAAVTVLRAYVDLCAALQGPEDKLTGRLDELRRELRRASGVRPQHESVIPAARANDPLSRLLGAPVPTRRAARIRTIERWIAANPDRVDDAAEAALQHHVEAFGPATPAPWLVGVVGLAIASGGAGKTEAILKKLREQGAVAVAAYDEWPFERLVRVMAAAHRNNHGIGGMRRGILAREEADDRKIWTLRLTLDGVERMVAVGPHATEPYADEKAAMLADRLLSLCPNTLLLATGSGNAGLRAAAAALGLSVMEHDADDEQILTTLAASGAPAPPPKGPPPTERLAEALQAEPFDAAAVDAAVGGFRRPDCALRPVLRLELDDERIAALLSAVHTHADADAAIPEGTTVAIRRATNGEHVRGLLFGPARERFGGPGIEAVVEVAAALMQDGWHVHRVLRGPTRRECREQPALQTLSESLGGLWRLLIRRETPAGLQRGEVWYLAALPVEGRAAVPLLLVTEHERSVLLPVDAEVLSWWGDVPGAPAALGWTGQEGDALREGVAAFRAEPQQDAPR